MVTAELSERVRSWIAQDPDPSTRQELEALLARGAEAELDERFSGQLEFGTAGLRGLLGGGPARMNRAVVRRATAGLAAYLTSAVAQAGPRGVVVGYDGRTMSRELAEEAASALAGAGLVVHFFERVVPTPLVAFSVREVNAAAGVMITASHNPPEYNGYKVYWENGAQIVSPRDKGISAAIQAVGPLLRVPTPSLDEARRKGLLNPLGVPIENRYLAELRRLALHPELSTQARAVSIVYTPLHGVGGKLGPQALAQAGFSRVFPVEAQLEPDPRFPTVRYPNPEEKGALDLSLALAREKDADLVLANDPDADRLAVAVRKGPGEHVQLTGDQVGALLGYYLLTEGKGGAERLVVSTVVSSPLLRYMAAELGAHYAETLTGFKWIANRAMALESERKLVLTFAYEEALGYAVCRAVRDKDGLSAAVVFAELAAFCRSRSSSVLEYLETIYRRFGLFKTAQRSVTLPGASGAAEIRAIMERLRASPLKSIGPVRVAATRDLLHGSELPSANVMAWDLEGGGRIVARPSGTEPKIKYYFELRETVASEEPLAAAQARIDERVRALIDGFSEITSPLRSPS